MKTTNPHNDDIDLLPLESESELDQDEPRDSVDMPLHAIKNQFETLVPLPEVEQDLSVYLTYPGLVALTLAPFTQGLFHGLGEGLARVVVGHYWMGMEPYLALGGSRWSARKPTRSIWSFFSSAFS
ncbi:hypothetical protein HDV03_000675 [Kappamyces sp. JEL0829]|nr:hypothetical protein HDV03_000675 [Kappamyces sp. JEL0829]